ncbi:MAG: hypothetical protein RL556_379 [Actinomycetota bacterium]|jgi:tight adherence protein B
MRWYRNLVAAAGFGNPSLAFSVGAPLAALLALDLSIFMVTKVTGLSLAAGFICAALFLEFLRMRSNLRVAAITKAWPQVVDSIRSAFIAGLDLESAISDLAKLGPKNLRKSFSEAAQMFNAGYRVDDCLNWLKVEFSTVASDQLFESLRLIHTLGGNSSLKSLASLSEQLRAEIALDNELNAKQGWIASTAKLGLIAPWFVVLLLSARPENASIYNSAPGVLVLVSGLVICMLAYFAIQVFGLVIQTRRVFVSES